MTLDGGDLDIDGAAILNTKTWDTAGPTDNVDVTDINILKIDTSSNNVTIGGFAGGVAGQILFVAHTSYSNTFKLEHNEGGGSQNIYLSSAADESKATAIGGWILYCTGSSWFELAN